MKRLILIFTIMISFVLAQNEQPSDSTQTDSTSTKTEPKLKTNDDFKVNKDDDKWMNTWKEIQPSIREFLSDDEDEDIEWHDDEYTKRKRKKKKGYFRGLAGGWDIFKIPIELDEINKQLKNIGLEEFDSDMNYFGGGGWVFLSSKYRIGGIGATGRMQSKKSVDNIRKKVDFNMSFGGFVIERVFHPFPKSEIYLSTVFGTSKTTFQVYKKQGQEDWNEAWDSFKNNNHDGFYNYKTTFSNRYFSALPSIGVRYNIFRIFAVGGKLGYYYGVAKKDNWKINGNEIGGVPKMDLSNIFYSINFYFGG